MTKAGQSVWREARLGGEPVRRHEDDVRVGREDGLADETPLGARLAQKRLIAEVLFLCRHRELPRLVPVARVDEEALETRRPRELRE